MPLKQSMWVLMIVLLLTPHSVVVAASIKLTWDYTQGTDPAVQFRVYRQIPVTGVCNGGWVGYGAVAYPTQTFVDTAVNAGVTYCYTVTAADSTGRESTKSNVVGFQVPDAQPAPPTHLQGTVGP